MLSVARRVSRSFRNWLCGTGETGGLRTLPAPKRREWSIGIYAGRSPVDLAPAPRIRNPVLTHAHVSDVPAEFVADPFMLRVDGTWSMFFEVMNRESQKGEIGLAVSSDGTTWGYQGIVLRESHHLSYPYVFESDGEFYMIPESYQVRSVRLYRAGRFPREWRFVQTLLDGMDYVDSSVLRFDGRWWMFAGTGVRPLCSDTLRLYWAGDVAGPWAEHPKSPIVDGDARIARPAGRVVAADGRIIRYAQDTYPYYGSRVRAFEISELTTTEYREREITDHLLAPHGTGWAASGMHHVDAHRVGPDRWLACVDGLRLLG
jgi:hypothetical protein